MLRIEYSRYVFQCSLGVLPEALGGYEKAAYKKEISKVEEKDISIKDAVKLARKYMRCHVSDVEIIDGTNRVRLSNWGRTFQEFISKRKVWMVLTA
jgi:hypothetical protein